MHTYVNNLQSAPYLKKIHPATVAQLGAHSGWAESPSWEAFNVPPNQVHGT